MKSIVNEGMRVVQERKRGNVPSASYSFLTMNRCKIFIISIFLVGIFTSCSDGYGVISGRFRLRDDSPLPSWLILPKGIDRDQVSVTIIIYEPTSGANTGKARFIVKKKHQFVNTIQEQIGSWRWHPDSLQQKAPANTYPNWIIIEVNGTNDVYEQSALNDLLRVVRKPLN